MNDDKQLLRDAATAIAHHAGGAVEPILGRIMVALGETTEEEAPVLVLASAWRSRLLKMLQEEQRALKSARDNLKRCLESKDDKDDEESLNEIISIYKSETERYTASVSGIEEALRGLEEDPASLLLPIGTVVELPGHNRSRMATPPVAGTRGVVVGYSIDHDCPLCVALPRDAHDIKGNVLEFNEERPHRFYHPRSELRQVGEAMLVGKGRTARMGYVPTHDRKDNKWQKDEMLVEAEGRIWRVMEINGVPENLGSASAEEEYGWLVRK